MPTKSQAVRRTPSKPSVAPYRWLAEYYDTVFAGMRAPMDAARAAILEPRILQEAQTVCDLACGTGDTALEFARRGLEVHAVDLSPGMCRRTREKAKTALLKVRVIHADMRDFRLPHPVDLITCEFDAVNHVPKKSDLLLVAKCAARALQPGGSFYFDVNNRRGFERYWGLTQWIEKPGVVVVMRGGQDAANDRAWTDVHWFVREQDSVSWRRHDERVEQVCWSEAEVWDTLRKAGFAEVQAWDAAPFFNPGSGLIDAGCRTVYLATRS